MSDEELAEVGRTADNYGDEIIVDQESGDVLVTFTDQGSVTMRFDAEHRDQFIRLWAEAERRAEAHGQEASDAH